VSYDTVSRWATRVIPSAIFVVNFSYCLTEARDNGCARLPQKRCKAPGFSRGVQGVPGLASESEVAYALVVCSFMHRRRETYAAEFSIQGECANAGCDCGHAAACPVL
jgi:hypothetical protein